MASFTIYTDDTEDTEYMITEEVCTLLDTVVNGKTWFQLLQEYDNELKAKRNNNKALVPKKEDFNEFCKKNGLDGLNDNALTVYCAYEVCKFSIDKLKQACDTYKLNKLQRSKDRRQRMSKELRENMLKMNVTKTRGDPSGGESKEDMPKEPDVSVLRTVRLHFRF